MRFQSFRTVVVVLLTTALIALAIASVVGNWRRFFLLCFPLFLASLTFAVYTSVFAVPPGHSLALVLAGTSREELVGFLSMGPGEALIALLAGSSAVYLVLALRLPSVPIRTPKAASSCRRTPALRGATLVLLVGVSAYVATKPADLIDGISYNPVIGAAMFLAIDVPRAGDDLKGAQVRKVPYHGRRAGGEEIHILVVGESARRDSWSVYGYKRHTTPYLESLKSEVIFLQNAVADANLTSWSVPIILTGATPEQLPTMRIRGNLLDLAKEAGFDTTWLVNQDIGISSYVGIQANHTTYPLEIQSGKLGRSILDESLLPAYNEQIARSGSARFIGIHSMGSHWVYKLRYPPRFERFGSAGGLTGLGLIPSDKNDAQQVVDAYDNSVAYTDWFLRQLIERARSVQVPATLTFFPDHGEDLMLFDGAIGHGGPTYTRHAFEIPAFVWVNDAYRKAHPQKVAALEANSSKEIRSHDVFATVADLMGITWPEATPRRSFASNQFVPDTAMRHVAGGLLVERQP